MSKKFLTDVIVQSAEMPAVSANRLAADLIAAIKAEIIETGRFTLPDFGAFVVRETPKRTALNPRTGEKMAVKAGATVKFKASPSLKEAAFAGLKKAKRKAQSKATGEQMNANVTGAMSSNSASKMPKPAARQPRCLGCHPR